MFYQHFKGAYLIKQRFLVHYKILYLSNIAIAILDFSLLLLPTSATAIVVALTRS
jgi:hypothetical protein